MRFRSQVDALARWHRARKRNGLHLTIRYQPDDQARTGWTKPQVDALGITRYWPDRSSPDL